MESQLIGAMRTYRDNGASVAMKILIIGQQPIVREGLKRILEDGMSAVTFGQAHGDEDALEQLAAGHWDLAILDTAMPGMTGFDLLKSMRATCPRVPVLVLSAKAEAQYAKWAFKAGAAGYLTTEATPEELASAVRRAVAGGRYVSPVLAERLAADLVDETDRAPHERLSMREFEVLSKLASGKTVTEIANELGLSVKTISTHRSRLLEKIGLRTTAELIRYALRNGLVE